MSIRIAQHGGPGGQDHAVQDAAREFGGAVDAMARHWIPVRVDGRATMAYGLVAGGDSGFSTCLAMIVRRSHRIMTITTRLGHMQPGQSLDVGALFAVQAATRLCRIDPDRDSGTLNLRAAVILPRTYPPSAVIGPLMNDLHAALNDDRLLAVAGHGGNQL